MAAFRYAFVGGRHVFRNRRVPMVPVPDLAFSMTPAASFFADNVPIGTVLALGAVSNGTGSGTVTLTDVPAALSGKVGPSGRNLVSTTALTGINSASYEIDGAYLEGGKTAPWSVTIVIQASSSPIQAIASGSGSSFTIFDDASVGDQLTTFSLVGGTPAGTGTWSIPGGTGAARVSFASGSTVTTATGLSPALFIRDVTGLSDGSSFTVEILYSGEGDDLNLTLTISVAALPAATEITTLTLVNRQGATAAASRIITGTPLAQGDCPDGSHIEIWRANGAPLTTQMLSPAALASDHPTDPGGTVMCGIAIDPGDSLANNATLPLRVMRVTGAPSSTAPVTKAAAKAALSAFNAEIAIDSISHPTRAAAATENAGVWELSLADALGGVEKGAGPTGGYGANPLRGYWFTNHGALVSTVRAFCWARRVSDGARHKYLYGVFFARIWHATGIIEWDCRVINLSTKGPLAGHVGSSVRESLTYNAVISDAANGTIATRTGLVHWASWSWFAADSKGKFLQSDGSAKPDVIGYLPGQYLYESEHLWAYHYDLAVRDFAVEVAAGKETDRDYSPLNLDGYTMVLNTTGDRREIGPFTTWGSKAVIRNDDAGWRKLTRVQELKAAHMPACDINEETGFPLLIVNTDAVNFPHLGTGSNLYARDPVTSQAILLNNASRDEAEGPWSSTYGNGEHILSFDHLASIGWIYLLEADERILEIMHDQVIRSFLNVNVQYQTVTVDHQHTPELGAGVYERVFYNQGGAQDRDRAWHFRQMFNADYWQPRDHPIAGLWRRLIETNMSYAPARLAYMAANPGIKQGKLTLGRRITLGGWGDMGNQPRSMGTFQTLHLTIAIMLPVMRKQTGWEGAEVWFDDFLINGSLYQWVGRHSFCPYYSRSATAIFVEYPNGTEVADWAEAQELDNTERGRTCPPTGVDNDSSVHYSQELRLIGASLIKIGKFAVDAQTMLDFWQSDVKQTVDVGPATAPNGTTIAAYHAKEIAYNPKYSAKIPP